MKYLSRQSRVLLLIFIIELSFRLGVEYSLQIFKLTGVLLLIFLTFISFKLLRKLKLFIEWKKLLPFLLFGFFYPLIHIFLDVILDFSFKAMTDGFIIRFSYYLLIMIALPQAILYTINNNIFEVLQDNIVICTVVIILSSITLLNFSSYGDVYTVISSYIIPFALLFFSSSSKYKYIGGFVFLFGVFMVNSIGSRSYFLVMLYFLVFFVRERFIKQKGNLKRGLILTKYSILFLIFYLSINLINININNYLKNSILVQKINVESLLDVLNDDSNSLYEKQYEGDSRSNIIEDAFRDFDMSDFVFGKGIFGQYKSFVTRNTIEVGWFQEAFWFGFISVFIILLFSLKSAYLCFLSNIKTVNILGIIVVIKILDAFIYGMPIFSTYNFLFFLGLIIPYVKIPKYYA